MRERLEKAERELKTLRISINIPRSILRALLPEYHEVFMYLIKEQTGLIDYVDYLEHVRQQIGFGLISAAAITEKRSSSPRILLDEEKEDDHSSSESYEIDTSEGNAEDTAEIVD